MGNADLYAAPIPQTTTWYPSITETLPPGFPKIKREFGQLEDLMWNQRPLSRAPTPVLAAANERINSVGYDYCPVHTEIYGTYRNQAKKDTLLEEDGPFVINLLVYLTNS